MLPVAIPALFLAAALPAQLFVVDPAGGGTHTDLQTAINAAPSGAVIRVVGGFWGPLTITRTLTIVGENSPQVKAPLIGIGQQPAAITLQGTGTETVVLGGLVISGDAEGFAWNWAGPGVKSTGFGRVAIHDCTVRGHDWLPLVTGAAAGASGIVVSGPATVHVSRSLVAASLSRAGSTNQWAPSGAAAIAAPAATVVLFDSTVNGGPVGPSVWQMGQPWPTPCPCQPISYPGRGGDGVVASAVHVSGSTITGGNGSPVYLAPPGGPVTTFGGQPDGMPVVASARTALPTTLAVGAPLRLGTVHTLAFAPTTALSVLALGAPAAAPAVVAGIPLVFVDVAQPFALHYLPIATSGWSLAVPGNPLLLGIELTGQRFDLGPGGALVATNAVLGVVLP